MQWNIRQHYLNRLSIAHYSSENMVNALVIRMITLAMGLLALPSVLSVCPGGDIGIGNGFASSGGEVCTLSCRNLSRLSLIPLFIVQLDFLQQLWYHRRS